MTVLVAKVAGSSYKIALFEVMMVVMMMMVLMAKAAGSITKLPPHLL